MGIVRDGQTPSVSQTINSEGKRTFTRSDGRKLKDSNDDPYYALLTLYDLGPEHQTDQTQTQNRRAWNAWVTQGLSPPERSALLAEVTQRGIKAEDVPHWAEIAAEVTQDYRAKTGLSDLPDPSGVKFDHLHFGSEAFFDHRIFIGTVSFAFSFFEKSFHAYGSHFSGGLQLNGAQIKESLNAFGLFVSGHTSLSDVYVGETLHFDSAVFEGQFSSTRLGVRGTTVLGMTRFGSGCGFSESSFSGRVFFEHTLFLGAKGQANSIRFSDCIFEGIVDFDGCVFVDSVTFEKTKFLEPAQFRGANFLGESDFTYVTFNNAADFEGAAFSQSFPRLSGTIFASAVRFNSQPSAKVLDANRRNVVLDSWPTEPKDMSVAIESAETIRHLMANSGRPEASHFFFRKEMGLRATRRHVDDRLVWGWLPIWFYGLVSEFGYSIRRPAACLVFIWAFGVAAFWGYLSGCCAIAPYPASDTPLFSAIGISFSNVFPFFGTSDLFSGDPGLHGLPKALRFFSASQHVFGLIFTFFFGLGLRTNFRLR